MIMPSFYAPLVAFLAAQPPTTTTVTVTLAEVEQVLGLALPASASTQTWWFGKHGRQRPKPWVAAGWRVARVSMRTATSTVTFARVALDATG
jgi:hypothetical protein